ncbi:hypothetical protein KO498_03455 [Lentibacter algarum]|uniref:hypothetical protein n=1 Tax=Lentibacter algarum TaxID=576131 RepID=UPI001C0712EF|nr:hypothetical protein [Lentibacter algarum]MBU2980862.1 hypothetical protein [Lentibacter algarum]
MYTPSLSFLLCLAAPLVGLWLAKRSTSALRIYLTLAAILAATSAYILVAEYALGKASKTSWLTTTTLLLGEEKGNSAITVQVDPAVPFVTAALLAVCALLVWLQNRKSALFFARFTGWLAAPLALFASGPELVLIAIPYISGMLKWEFAAASVKTAGIIGVAGLAVFCLALLGFIAQLFVSLVKRLRG